MISLALISGASLLASAENVETTIDPVIQAVTAAEATVSGPSLAEMPVAATPSQEAAAVAATLLATTPPATASVTTGTPIDWGASGGTTVLASESSSAATSGASGMMNSNLILLPFAFGLFGAAWFYRKKVFTAVAAKSASDPMTVISRKSISGNSSVILIDVESPDGTTRRLLVGSGDGGVNLVADVSPTGAIFPDLSQFDEPAFQAPAMAAPAPQPVAVTPKPTPPSPRREPVGPAAITRLSADAIGSNIKRKESSSSGEMPRFRKRKAPVAPVMLNDTPASEKRAAAQAVLDEVLAERRATTRGSQVRVTA